MYKSQLKKIDIYDWFCGPGSHMEASLEAMTVKYFSLVKKKTI